MIRIKLQKTIAFNPELARIFGDVQKALFIQQLIFWSDKGNREDGFIYKTAQELEEETGLSRYQQKRCRDYFVKIGVLEEKVQKANGAPTLHFRVDEQKIQQIIDEYEKNAGNNWNLKKLKNGNSRNLKMEIQETSNSITENTTENTTYIKNSGKDSALKRKNSSLKEEEKEKRESSAKERKEKEEVQPVAQAVELTRFFYKTLRPDIPPEAIVWEREVRNMKLLLKKMEPRKIRAYIEAIKNCKGFYCLNCNSPTYFYSNLQNIYEELYRKGGRNE